MLHYFIYVILITNAMSISSPGSLTREVGQDVVFMFNASNIETFKWGIRKGNTNNLKQGLMNCENVEAGVKLDEKINSTSYAGRVSFVGDLSKGQAWFKITNLNINDTNQYLAWIFTQGASGYTYVPAQLNVTIPSTSPPTTSMTSLKSTSLSTQDLTTLPIATSKPTTLTNLTTYLEVEETFSEEMKNKDSFSFQNFSNKFENAIRGAYSGENNFKTTEVTSLSEGSIHVNFVVFFKSEIKYEQACTPLEKAIENGTLGSFKVVPGSLGCSERKTSSPPPPGPSTGMHPALIGGLAVIGVLAIAGLIIAIIFVCRKKESKKDYRSSTRPARGYEMEIRHGEPEEQYSSVQRPGASGAKQSPENDQPLPQYAVVDKSKKKKKTKEPGELIYAQLDHDYNASMGTKPPSDRRPTGETDDTVYADIQGDKKKQHPPPQYGNIHDMSYA